MATVTLHQFIDKNRDELITRCRAKVAKRSAPPPTEAEIDHGVPLFLNQLCEELRHGPSETHEISKGAMKHGHDLLVEGFNISQVVHGYGDVCQSITDLAVETGAPIGTDDFRTLNRCLDDAIAGAVTEFSRAQDITRDGESHEMRDLIHTATTAFEVLRTGNVGVGGSTGAVILRSLRAMDALVNRQSAPIAPAATDSKGR
jgi:hypothetical protein